MEQLDISRLNPLTYSMLLNKDKKNKETVLNLEKLVTVFSLDISDRGGGVYEPTKLPGFVSKSFYQTQNLDKPDKHHFSYNFPPKGPIPPDFMCLFCQYSGPKYHKETCRRPFDSSLVLEKTTTRFPGAERGTQYNLIVKKSGQKKIISKRPRSETFTDNVEIIYQYPEGQRATIRISRNGTINIISAQHGDSSLPEKIVQSINKNASGVIVAPPFAIKSGYVYLMSAQFNIIKEPLQKTSFIDLNEFHNVLWTLPIFKKRINGEIVFMVGEVSNYYFVEKYNYNSGEQYSKNLKMTNPYIQFNLISPANKSAKIHVMIYRKGAVQLRLSNTQDTGTLHYSSLEQCYEFLRALITEILVQAHTAEGGILQNETITAKKSKIPNMVDGRQPQVCQNRKSGGGEMRPVPYSFYGMCPMKGYYVRGVKRPDGKYEPCCYKLKETKGTQHYVGRARKALLHGYPDNEMEIHGETISPDDSAVFVPGTKRVESRGFPGLINMSKEEIINCLENSGYIITNPNVFQETKKRHAVVAFKKYTPLITLDHFTKSLFMVTPVFQDTLRVKLMFDAAGRSYFINELGDISESGINVVVDLAETTIDGWVYPFRDPEFKFYPNDITSFKGTDVSRLDYYDNPGDTRWKFLQDSLSLIEPNLAGLSIRSHNFDLNIVEGSEYFTNNPEVSGLIFISRSGDKTFMWSDNLHGDILISVDVNRLKNNIWVVSHSGKVIEPELLPQGKSYDVNLGSKFSNGKPDAMILLCKLNLLQTTFKINTIHPLIPLEQLSAHINSYAELMNILESTNKPIMRSVFDTINKDPLGFSFNGKNYRFSSINEPLVLA